MQRICIPPSALRHENSITGNDTFGEMPYRPTPSSPILFAGLHYEGQATKPTLCSLSFHREILKTVDFTDYLAYFCHLFCENIPKNQFYFYHIV